MIARGIDGLVMLVCAFLIGWHLVPATAPAAPQPAPDPVAPAPAPVAECPQQRVPVSPSPPRPSAVDPTDLPAIYRDIIGLPAR